MASVSVTSSANRDAASPPPACWTAPARKAQARLREAFPELFAFHTIESLANDADRLAGQLDIHMFQERARGGIIGGSGR